MSDLIDALRDARNTLTKTATGKIGGDQMTIARSWFDSVVRNLDKAIAAIAPSAPVESLSREELLKLEAELEERLLAVTEALAAKGRPVPIHASGPSPLDRDKVAP